MIQRDRGVSPKSSWWIPNSRRSSSSGRSWSSTRRSTNDVREPRVPLLRPDDEDRRRLLAAAVAAGRLGGVEAVEKPLGERTTRARLERLGERVDGCGRDEDVALRRVTRAGPVPGPVVALGARVRGRASLSVDDAELALCPVLVGLRQSHHGLLRGRVPREGARGRQARTAGLPTTAWRSRRRTAPPRGRRSRPRGTSTAPRRPTAAPRGRRRRWSTSRRPG